MGELKRFLHYISSAAKKSAKTLLKVLIMQHTAISCILLFAAVAVPAVLCGGIVPAMGDSKVGIAIFTVLMYNTVAGAYRDWKREEEVSRRIGAFVRLTKKKSRPRYTRKKSDGSIGIDTGRIQEAVLFLYEIENAIDEASALYN